MILGLFKRRKANQRVVQQIYRTLTEAGRAAELYAVMGVPDTVMGRFEMLSAHMVLFLRRAEAASPAVKDLAQEVVDAFFEDIDHSMREIGIGDMGVPKRMKKFARMFYGRADAYSKAVAAGDRPALAEALSRNVFPNGRPDDGSGMLALAEYLMAVDDEMTAWPDGDILSGRVALAGAGGEGFADAPPPATAHP